MLEVLQNIVFAQVYLTGKAYRVLGRKSERRVSRRVVVPTGTDQERQPVPAGSECRIRDASQLCKWCFWSVGV